MVSKYVLASGSSTNAQRCSAGCNSGGLENEADAFGHEQIFRAVPTGPVELKHRTLLVADSDRFGEVREDGLEHFFGQSQR